MAGLCGLNLFDTFNPTFSFLDFLYCAEVNLLRSCIFSYCHNLGYNEEEGLECAITNMIYDKKAY